MPHTLGDDQDIAEAPLGVTPATKFFQVGHSPEEGFYLEVEQNMDGKLLEQIFAMVEKNFGLRVVDEDDNDAVILDNGNVRIWMEESTGFFLKDFAQGNYDD